MKNVRGYKLSSTFLKDIKDHKITYAKLKPILFGEHAIAFIKAIRKHGQPAFTDLKKAHQFMYMVEVAFESYFKKQNQ